MRGKDPALEGSRTAFHVARASRPWNVMGRMPMRRHATTTPFSSSSPRLCVTSPFPSWRPQLDLPGRATREPLSSSTLRLCPAVAGLPLPFPSSLAAGSCVATRRHSYPVHPVIPSRRSWLVEHRSRGSNSPNDGRPLLGCGSILVAEQAAPLLAGPAALSDNSFDAKAQRRKEQQQTALKKGICIQCIHLRVSLSSLPLCASASLRYLSRANCLR
jgi:hypothetical protein